MSGNLGRTYESFLTRCIGGVRKEQEVLREANEIHGYLAVLVNEGNALGMPEGWASEGAEGLMESYREGKALAEQEGDVYAFRSALANRVKHCEGTLNAMSEELQKQHGEIIAKAEKGLADANKALKEAEKAVEEAKTKKKEAEENKEQAEGCGCLLLVAFVMCLLTGVLAPVAILVFIFMRKKKRQKRELEETVKSLDGSLAAATALVKQRKEEVIKAKKETEKAKEALAAAEKAKKSVRAARLAPLRNAVKGLGSGRGAGETKVLELPGGVPMEMVWCPPGMFAMGSPEDEERPQTPRQPDETQHKVTLTKGFWLAKTPVTQKQWKSVMGNNPSKHLGDALPVEMVSWDDCQEFCKNTGLSLPTESQWEYACRAGSTAAYGGTGHLDDMGWYYVKGVPCTHPVGEKKPNVWGLYDMHGNVCEWCADWFGDYPRRAVTDPNGAASGSYRVVRGGSCRHIAVACRSATRSCSSPDSRKDNQGFRPAAR